jgi:integrase
MRSNVEKRCGCDEAKWPKCAPHPWYLKTFRWGGKVYEPNLTRLASLANVTIEAKTEADAFAETVRTAIRDGKYTPAKAVQSTVAPKTEGLPLGRPSVVKGGKVVAPGSGVVALFEAEVITGDLQKRERTKQGDRACLRKFAEFEPPDTKRGALASWPLVDITAASIVAFRRCPVLADRANSTWAKYRTAIAQLFAWSTANGYMTADPFASLQPQQLKALKRGKPARRSRRVDVVEEANLIRAAGRAQREDVAGRLSSLIVCAVESGLRRGELLALQWGHVSTEHRTITVAAVEIGASKTGNARMVPMSQRFADELELIKTDPNGDRFGRTCYVFGDAVGGRVQSVKKAWESAVLHAHAVTPQWSKTGNSLTPASRAALRRIDLHFHDLRHEAGSRWLESRLFDLEQIRQIYGHQTIAQTANYLHGGSRSAHTAMAALDSARAELAKADKRAAANAPADAPNADKLRTNAKTAEKLVAKPRLVKSDKPRGGV